MEFRQVGWGDPALVYDEEKDLFRFVDGRFAFSREPADQAMETLCLAGRDERSGDGSRGAPTCLTPN